MAFQDPFSPFSTPNQANALFKLKFWGSSNHDENGSWGVAGAGVEMEQRHNIDMRQETKL